MMLQTGSFHCFRFLFLLCTLHLSPMLAYLLKDCTIVYSENSAAGVSVDCERRQLVGVPDDIPRGVTSLTLQRNVIRKISRTDFYRLSNLSHLELGFNSIAHVDDGAFVHLMELKVLHMNRNNLTILTDNMFQGLSNLEIMRLDVNKIQFINPAAFQLLPSLEALNLESNHIHRMTDIITILQLPRLQVLHISIHELVSFQSKDLPSNMSCELRELRVNSESIQNFSITTAAFPHLESIDLSECCDDGWEWVIPDKSYLRNISKVHFSDHGRSASFNSIRKSLQSLDSLEYLELSDTQKWIKGGLLNIACKIPTLRRLKLTYSRIANLSEQLAHCTQLTDLDLPFNYVSELPKNSIKQMKQLSHLNLEDNHLSKVPDDVKNLSMLQILNLMSNEIIDLSCLDLLHLTRLTHLHLDYNQIQILKGCVFQHLHELKVLTLRDNNIVLFISTFTFGLEKLQYLDLRGNLLPFLQKGDFTGLKSLKHFNMESRKSVELDGNAFAGLDSLETLSLIVNVVKVNKSLFDLPSLNSLTRLTIQCNAELFTPHRSYITFNNTPHLEALNLSNNKLKSLDFLAQANLTRLSCLDLSQNDLTVINVSVFRFLPALRYVNMADNPFDCDCSNYDFQKWMQNNNKVHVVDVHRYTCAYPLARKGTRLLDFDYRSCWVDASFICYISSTCVIVLTLLVSFTYHFLRLHLLYAYYLFLAVLHDTKERKKGSPQRYDAFISYNVHDELWVCREMLPVLEGEQGWRLCLHHRDFLPGKAIIENITDAIYGSRKTICVISHHYLESEWCSREIQMASYRLFDEQKDVLILVFLEDIPAQQLSPYFHMRRLVKRQTYLSWSQARQHPGLFWQNLRRALDTPDADPSLNE